MWSTPPCAGLDDVTFHTLRHSFASMLIVGLKMDVESVSCQLGHVRAPSPWRRTATSLTRHGTSINQLRDALEGEFVRISNAAS
jgi:integrase